jgi:hypothetical protein
VEKMDAKKIDLITALEKIDITTYGILFVFDARRVAVLE